MMMDYVTVPVCDGSSFMVFGLHKVLNTIDKYRHGFKD
jgi:hypothetical protein